MLLYGWKRGKLLGSILTFAGSSLIARGLTGKSLHQALNDWAREVHNFFRALARVPPLPDFFPGFSPGLLRGGLGAAVIVMPACA